MNKLRIFKGVQVQQSKLLHPIKQSCNTEKEYSLATEYR